MEQDKKDLIAMLIVSIFVSNLFLLFNSGDMVLLLLITICMLVFPVTILKIYQIYNKEVLKNGN